MSKRPGRWGTFQWNEVSRELSYTADKKEVWSVAIPPSIEAGPLMDWIADEAETGGWEIRSLQITFLNRKDPSMVPLPLVFLKGEGK